MNVRIHMINAVQFLIDLTDVMDRVRGLFSAVAGKLAIDRLL